MATGMVPWLHRTAWTEGINRSDVEGRGKARQLVSLAIGLLAGLVIYVGFVAWVGAEVLNGGTMFEVRCRWCWMRFQVDRIRDAEAATMADHLRERHPEIHLRATAALGEILDHYCVKPVSH